MKEKAEKQEKLQIYFPAKTIEELEIISENMGIKRSDVVKIATKKYIDDYKKTNNK